MLPGCLSDSFESAVGDQCPPWVIGASLTSQARGIHFCPTSGAAGAASGSGGARCFGGGARGRPRTRRSAAARSDPERRERCPRRRRGRGVGSRVAAVLRVARCDGDLPRERPSGPVRRSPWRTRSVLSAAGWQRARAEADIAASSRLVPHGSLYTRAARRKRGRPCPRATAGRFLDAPSSPGRSSKVPNFRCRCCFLTLVTGLKSTH